PRRLNRGPRQLRRRPPSRNQLRPQLPGPPRLWPQSRLRSRHGRRHRANKACHAVATNHDLTRERKKVAAYCAGVVGGVFTSRTTSSPSISTGPLSGSIFGASILEFAFSAI